MKWYVVVEGHQTEKKLYGSWVAHAFPGLEPVRRIEDMAEQRYFLLRGGGYPQYLDRVCDSIADIRANPGLFDHLMICVDAEECAVDERRATIATIIAEERCPVPCTIVVHDCCIETWLLGNRKLARVNPDSNVLRAYYDFYNVRDDDPEHMPAMTGTIRAHFHLAYLQELFREHGMSYTKVHPGDAYARHYLEQLVKRSEDTGHLASFGHLVQSWRSLGGHL